MQQQQQQSAKSETMQAAAAAMNATNASEKCAATSRSKATNNRCMIAVIVYLALLLDNILLTVIVPILPDYLALKSINNNTALVAPPIAGSGGVILAHNLAYRNVDGSPLQPLITKHPIPGKSMVNFSLHLSDNKQETLQQQQQQSLAANQQLITTPTTSKYENNLAEENGSIGLLLATKAFVQLIANMVVGNISARVGYRLPIVVGTFGLLISSLVFAIGESYWMLLFARAVQGIGSACIGVCGMSLIAQNYPEEEKRSKVMGIVLGSIALGVLLGYPFGSILYDLVGKSAPFIILSTVLFLNLGLQLLVMDLAVQPDVITDNNTAQPQKWRPLLESKMILAIVVAIGISTSSMAILEPCLPIWLIQYLKPNKWELGTVFIPDSVGYFLGTNFFGSIAYKYGQIKISCISLLLVGISAILIPSATTVAQLLLPHFGLGLGIGIIDAALVPLLATFVDDILSQDQGESGSSCEHSSISSYGTVYAIQQTSVSLAYSFAPLLGGELAQNYGFPWLMHIVGFLNMIYCPVLLWIYQNNDPKSMRERHNDMLLTAGRGSQYKQLYNTME